MEAAISVGDLDAANNVAVFTPGFSSTAQGLGHNVKDLSALQKRIAADNPRKPSTASVVWLGYQAPQLDGIANPSDSVASTQEAQHGAPRLAAFLRGIRASHTQPVDVTAIGHSYGSLVTGLALKEGGNPDKVVFLGSPGVGVEHSAELHAPSRNIYAEDAIYDPVPDLQPYDGFGADPRDLESAHVLDSESATVKETNGVPRSLTGILRHSHYFDNGTTSQYDLAQIIAGKTRNLRYASPDNMAAWGGLDEQDPSAQERIYQIMMTLASK